MPINCYEFQLCRAAESCNCKQASIQKAPLYTADWLRRCVRNPSVLMALRGIGKSSGGKLSDNEGIIKLIAGQIASGELRVCQGQNAVSNAAGDPGSAASQAAGSNKPFPFNPRPKTAPQSLSSNDSDGPGLADNLDGAAQAAALNAAASQGAPFCPE